MSEACWTEIIPLAVGSGRKHTEGKVGSVLPLYYLVKGNLYGAPEGPNALWNTFAQVFKGFWLRPKQSGLVGGVTVPWHNILALAFTGAWPDGVRWSLPGVVFPSCKNSPEFQRLQKFQPLLQACLFSLGPSA